MYIGMYRIYCILKSPKLFFETKMGTVDRLPVPSKEIEVTTKLKPGERYAKSSAFDEARANVFEG